MTQGQFTISDTTSPTAIIPQWNVLSDAQLLTNIGANTIWLGNDSTVSVTSGFPLQPSATKAWDGNQPLYAVCAPGAASTLQMIDNTGELFDPSAIATSLLTSGLAAQIATAINLIGVPPIDRAAELYNASQIVAMGAAYNSPLIDCSLYNSLSIMIGETNGAGGSCLVPRDVYLWSFADSLGATLIDGRRYNYMPSGGSIIITPSMARGPYLQIGFAPLAAGAANAQVFMQVSGSMRTTGTQERVEILNVQGGAFTSLTGDEGIWQANGNWPAGTSSEFPITYGGPASLGWEFNPIAGAASHIRLIDQGTGLTAQGVTLPVSAGTQRGTIPIYLPLRQIRIDVVNNTGGAVAGRLSLTMDGNR